MLCVLLCTPIGSQQFAYILRDIPAEQPMYYLHREKRGPSPQFLKKWIMGRDCTKFNLNYAHTGSAFGTNVSGIRQQPSLEKNLRLPNLILLMLSNSFSSLLIYSKLLHSRWPQFRKILKRIEVNENSRPHFRCPD